MHVYEWKHRLIGRSAGEDQQLCIKSRSSSNVGLSRIARFTSLVSYPSLTSSTKTTTTHQPLPPCVPLSSSPPSWQSLPQPCQSHKMQARPLPLPRTTMAYLALTSLAVGNSDRSLGTSTDYRIGSAAAAEDGANTSSTSTSECNAIDCSSGASAAGGNSSSASSSSTFIRKFARFLQ